MSNSCFYDMLAVGKKEDLDRLVSIMKYEDPEYYIYRVKELEVTEEGFVEKGSDLKYIQILGDVANSSSSWAYDEPKPDKNGMYVSLVYLSKLLHLNIEWQTEGTEEAFQEHFAIVDGELKIEENTEWSSPGYEEGEFDDDELMEDVRSRLRDCYDEKKANDLFLPTMERINKGLNEWKYVYVEFGGYVLDYDPVALSKGDVHKWKIAEPYIDA